MEAEVAEVKRVSGHLRRSNIYDEMHTLQIGECRAGAKSVRKQKCSGLYLLKTRKYASVNTSDGSFFSCLLQLLQQYRTIEKDVPGKSLRQSGKTAHARHLFCVRAMKVCERICHCAILIHKEKVVSQLGLVNWPSVDHPRYPGYS